MGLFSDLWGTTKSYFKIGSTTGVRLKNNAGALVVRNTGDSADSSITVSELYNSGDSLQLNSDAAGSGADWLLTIARPASGMTAAWTFTFPTTPGTSGYVLQTDGAGNTSWVSAGSTAAADKLDTTTLAYNSTSPVTMFTTGASDIIDLVEVIIDTQFNTAATMSVGVSGTTSKYAGTTDVDLTAAAGTVFEVHPALTAQGAENLIITYSAASASAGSARVIVHFATPS